MSSGFFAKKALPSQCANLLLINCAFLGKYLVSVHGIYSEIVQIFTNLHSRNIMPYTMNLI